MYNGVNENIQYHVTWYIIKIKVYNPTTTASNQQHNTEINFHFILLHEHRN